MDNEQSVPSLMPVGSDTCTHNVVRGSPSIEFEGTKVLLQVYIIIARLQYAGQTLKTTHNVKHSSSVRINHSIPHVSFYRG